MNELIDDVVASLRRSTKQHHLHISHSTRPDVAKNQIRDFVAKITPIATSGQSDIFLISGVIPKSKIR